jgi:glycosyltransferase involved in cell wall biosynthesis
VRITFILPVANMSGGTKVVAIYATELARRGHTVCVFSAAQQRLSLVRKTKRWVRGGGWVSEQMRQRSHLDGLDLDHRVIGPGRPIVDGDVPDADVVVATWWETAEWVNALSRQKGAKAYFVQHHEVFPYLPVERCHATYRLKFHKIVVADWLRRVMKAEYQDDVVDLVPNSVDRSVFFSALRGKQPLPTVGFLYAPAESKGLDLTLAAIARIRQQVPGLRILSFGDRPPVPGMSLIRGTEYSVLPSLDEIRNIYSSCDVWITASRSEGFNLPAMEAMACRTPVVSTKTGWPEEVIKSEWNGVLVDIGDVDGLVRAIEWVLARSEEDWVRLSAKAYETVANSSWDNSATLFEEALKHACERARRREIDGGDFAVPSRARLTSR